MNPLRRFTTNLALASCALAGALSAQAERDGFAGRFANEQSSLRIERVEEAPSGRLAYRGEMTVGQVSLNLRATRQLAGSELTGRLTQGERSFPFEARLRDGGIEVESGGKTRFLKRVVAEQSQAARLVLQKASIRDRFLNGVASHTMLLPEGYAIEGGVLWTPGAVSFQTMNLRVHNGRGTEMRMLPRRTFRMEPPQQLAMRGQQIGSVVEMGNVIRPVPEGEFGEFLDVVLPALRPQAQNVRVLKQQRLPETERFIRENSSFGKRDTPGTRRDFRVVRTLVRYEEGGREYEEQVWHSFFASYGSVGAGFGQSPIVHWMVDGLRGCRVPVDELEPRSAELSVIASSFRTTPRWNVCQHQLQTELSRQRHLGSMAQIESFGQISRRIYESSAELSEAQMSSWKRRMASGDRVQRRSVDAIWGSERYRGRDGFDLVVGDRFEHVFEAADGSVIAVEGPHWSPIEDPAFSQKDWRRLGRVDG